MTKTETFVKGIRAEKAPVPSSAVSAIPTMTAHPNGPHKDTQTDSGVVR